MSDKRPVKLWPYVVMGRGDKKKLHVPKKGRHEDTKFAGYGYQMKEVYYYPPYVCIFRRKSCPW